MVLQHRWSRAIFDLFPSSDIENQNLPYFGKVENDLYLKFELLK